MTIEGPKPARGQEIRSAAELGGRVFRRHSPRPGKVRLPTPAADEVRENLRVFTADGKVVSVVVMPYREVALLRTRHLACCLGGVCTDPDYRGRGLATRLLADARDKAVAQGADIVLISGRRGLYRRQGYIQVGHFYVCTVARSRLPAGSGGGPRDAGYILRAPTPEDLPALVRMYVAEPVRFVRTPEELLRLVGSTRVLNARGETQVVCPAGSQRPVAYVAYQIGGAPWERMDTNAVRVVEMAGSRWAIAHALRGLLDQYGLDALELHYGGCDTEMAAMAHGYGWPSEPRGFRGTVGIINPSRFWDASAALFSERLGAERFGRLKFTADETVRIGYGAEELVLEDARAFTRLAFEHPASRHELQLGLAPESELARVLEELFPMPVVNYGLNYF